ncbi:MAG TPA: hypothetical protein VFY50_00525 [Candidatus Nitrosocosmicus sp.]|nr:hypothetical protein [Candidatus Nitrosocosmicus sp.]
MTIIPFVFLVLVVLTIPTAFGSLNEEMIDMYEQLNNADRFNERMHTFISECYERIDLPIAEQQECTSVISKFNTQVTDLESTHGNIINKMVPPVQQEEEEEEEDENDVPNEATTEQTIIPGGDVDQTYINEQSDSLQTPVAPHGNTAGQVGTDHDDSSSDDNDSQLNEGGDSGNQNEGEGEGERD